MRLAIKLIAIIAIFQITFTSSAFGQSLFIIEPSSPTSFPEGDDFASNVLKNPWDFETRRDIGHEENVDPASVNVTGGIWRANNLNGADTLSKTRVGNRAATDAAVLFPLHGGFEFLANRNPLQGDDTLPSLGENSPLDTSRYTYLSYRLKHTERTEFFWSWESDPDVGLQPVPGSPNVSRFDGFNHNTVDYNFASWHLYMFDMTDLTSEFDFVSGAWTGNVFSLRFEPSIFSSSGETVELDWMRIVDPSTAPDITVTWSAFVSPSEAIVVYIDNDNVGFNGTPIAVFPDGVDPGTMTFPGAALPPGTWYFYVEVVDPFSTFSTTNRPGTKVSTRAILTSGYSSSVTIKARPSGYFLAPTETSGEDYASQIVGSAWDMGEEDDILNLDTDLFSDDERGFIDWSLISTTEAELGGNVFQATSDIPTYPDDDDNMNLDPPTLDEILFDILFSEASKLNLRLFDLEPIDPNRFRYASVRMRTINDSGQTNIDRLLDGYYVSFGFNALDIFTAPIGGLTEASFIYEDWHTYTFDLWDDDLTEGAPWNINLYWTSFFLNAIESDVFATDFQVDWVELHADNHTVSDQYEISFHVDDADSTQVNVALYYDADDQNFDGTLIANLPNIPTNSDQTYLWDTSALPDGERFYIYMVITDENGAPSRFDRYSPTSILIGDAETVQLDPVAFDYDGDRKSDPVVFRPSTNQFFQRRSSAGLVSVFWALFPQFNYRPLEGDFDGDGITDIAVTFPYLGYHAYYIHNSSTDTVTVKVWGFSSADDIVIADYDGDGSDDITAFRDGVWYILENDGDVTIRFWGGPGDRPVPLDFDGDLIDDIAVWRPTTGEWFIVNSTITSLSGASTISYAQWGLPGDIPVAADYNSDGLADVAVWRPSTGTWYIRETGSEEETAYQWGMTGDRPKIGDFNGDGFPDFTVYRPSTGHWFINLRNRRTLTTQFGLPGDLLPSRRQPRIP